ncbi:hypothetical protein [Sporisorium scitamineum]|nr:hypothetical protein [Sporisorium scitamineum]
MRWICAVTALLVVATGVMAGPLPTFDPAVQSLTASNFTSSTDKGMWLVEFYSPWCKYCKHFAPTFHDIAESNRHLEDSSDFHIARVNCIAQNDLCQRQNIDAYPSIELYRDGTWFETYEGGRGYNELDAYIQARAADHRKLMAVFGSTRQ